MFGPKKKVVLKPYSSLILGHRKNVDEYWQELSRDVKLIFCGQSNELSFQHLYDICYNIVLLKGVDLLMQGFNDLFRQFVDNKRSLAENLQDDSLLKRVAEEFSRYRTSLNDTESIAMYLTNNILIPRGMTSIFNLGLVAFRECFIEHENIRGRLRALLLRYIKDDRDGKIINKDDVHNVLKIFSEISSGTKCNFYETEFEVHFLTETFSYYELESRKVFNEYRTCYDFVSWAYRRLCEEDARVATYLLSQTGDKLKNVLLGVWIQSYASELIDLKPFGLNYLLDEYKKDEIKMMYALFRLVPSAVEVLRDSFVKYIQHKAVFILGLDNTVEVDDAPKCICEFIQFKRVCSDFVRYSFLHEKQMTRKVRECLDQVCSSNPLVAKYLSTYIDDILRRNETEGGEILSEEEISERFSSAIAVFRHISDKDVFESFYKSQMSRRLLSIKPIALELEKLVISRLKLECGYQFTARLEGMVSDILISRSLMEEYQNSLESLSISSNSISVGGLSVNVLTAGYWPLPASVGTLPTTLQHTMDSYSNFYLTKHSGRKLSWQFQLGNAEIRFQFACGFKDFIVSTCQMFILQLFSDCNRVDYRVIKEQCSFCEANELKRHLISLCTPKVRILLKKSKGKVINEDDYFVVNEEFTSKYRKIKVPLVSMKEILTEATESLDVLPSEVDESRRLLIEAAIVRTMKARKSIVHSSLVAEVIHQLSYRFSCSSLAIKQRIESLIEREYISRSPSDVNIYCYIA